MNFYKTGAAILLSTALFACDSDNDDSHVPEVVTITAELGLTGSNGISSTSTQGYPATEFRDSSGYAHFLRTDAYKVEIIDSIDGYGEDYVLADGIDITTFEQFEFQAQGDAIVKVSFIGEHTNEGAYKYYTAHGEQAIDREKQSVRIEMENKDYNFVVFRTEDTESLSLLETNVNKVTIGAVRETCMMEKGKEVCNHDPYSYNYITEDSIAEFVSYAGESFTKELIIDATNAPGIIDFGTITINGESGTIVIKEPSFDPINLDPNVPAVLTNSDLTGGSITSTNLDSGEVIVKGDKAEFWGYPETLFFKGDKALNDYNVNIEINEIELFEKNNVFANIYIEKGTEKKAFSLQLTGNVGEVTNNETNNVEFATYSEFLLAYGDWIVTSKADAGRIQTNFIVRFGDSNQDATASSWLIKRFSITEK